MYPIFHKNLVPRKVCVRFVIIDTSKNPPENLTPKFKNPPENPSQKFTNPPENPPLKPYNASAVRASAVAIVSSGGGQQSLTRSWPEFFDLNFGFSAQCRYLRLISRPWLGESKEGAGVVTSPRKISCLRLSGAVFCCSHDADHPFC